MKVNMPQQPVERVPDAATSKQLSCSQWLFLLVLVAKEFQFSDMAMRVCWSCERHCGWPNPCTEERRVLGEWPNLQSKNLEENQQAISKTNGIGHISFRTVFFLRFAASYFWFLQMGGLLGMA